MRRELIGMLAGLVDPAVLKGLEKRAADEFDPTKSFKPAKPVKTDWDKFNARKRKGPAAESKLLAADPTKSQRNISSVQRSQQMRGQEQKAREEKFKPYGGVDPFATAGAPKYGPAQVAFGKTIGDTVEKKVGDMGTSLAKTRAKNQAGYDRLAQSPHNRQEGDYAAGVAARHQARQPVYEGHDPSTMSQRQAQIKMRLMSQLESGGMLETSPEYKEQLARKAYPALSNLSDVATPANVAALELGGAGLGLAAPLLARGYGLAQRLARGAEGTFGAPPAAGRVITSPTGRAGTRLPSQPAAQPAQPVFGTGVGAGVEQAANVGRAAAPAGEAAPGFFARGREFFNRLKNTSSAERRLAKMEAAGKEPDPFVDPSQPSVRTMAKGEGMEAKLVKTEQRQAAAAAKAEAKATQKAEAAAKAAEKAKAEAAAAEKAKAEVATPKTPAEGEGVLPPGSGEPAVARGRGLEGSGERGTWKQVAEAPVKEPAAPAGQPTAGAAAPGKGEINLEAYSKGIGEVHTPAAWEEMAAMGPEAKKAVNLQEAVVLERQLKDRIGELSKGFGKLPAEKATLDTLKQQARGLAGELKANRVGVAAKNRILRSAGHEPSPVRRFAQDRPRTAGLGALTAGGLGVAGLTETGRNLAGKAGRWAGKKFGPSGVTPAKTVGGGVSPRQQKVSPETGRAVGETKPSTAPAGSVDEVLAGGKQTPATPAKPAAASQKPAYTFKNKLVQKHIPAEQLKGLSASNRKLLESLTPEEAKKLWGTK